MTAARIIVLSAALSISASFLAQFGCEKEQPAPPAKPSAAASSASHDGHDHAAAGDQHEHADGHADDHGPVTQLGEQAVGGFTVKASRDGAITPGRDAPVDAWISVGGGGGDGAAKVAAVRFWIGSQDAKGSVKAKAALEKDNWHTHVEIPAPLPAGSRLWVEVETDKGDKLVAGFDLKQ